MKNKNKSLLPIEIKWVYFFLLSGLSSFIIATTNLLESSENQILSFLAIIFILMGFSIGFISIHFFKKKMNFSILNFLLVLFSSLIIFIFPLYSFNTTHSLLILSLMLFIIFLIGFVSSLLIDYLGGMLSLSKKEKENFWVYLGLFAGALFYLFINFLIPLVYVNLIPFLFFLISAFISDKGERIIRGLLIFILIVICGVFYLFYSYHLFLNTMSNNTLQINGSGKAQIKISSPVLSSRNIIDISEKYVGDLPTYKTISIGGKEYDFFVQAMTESQYINFTPYKVIYSLKPKGNSLILNSRGGFPVYAAHVLSTGSIEAVEKSQSVLSYIRDDESAYVGGIYHSQSTIFYRSSVRSYVASSSKRYDVILLPFQIYGNDGNTQNGEEYLVTKKALRSYIDHLNPNGLLDVYIKTPSPLFTKAIALNIINTIRQIYPNPSDILKHILVFNTVNSVSIILTKNMIDINLYNNYNNLLTNLSYHNDLNPLDKNNNNLLAAQDNFTSSVTAVISGNQNQLEVLTYPIGVIKDGNPYWLLSLNTKTNINNAEYTLIYFVLLFVGIIVFSILVLFLYINKVKKNLGKKIPVMRFLAFYGSQGLALGIILTLWLQVLSFLFQQELHSANILISEFFMASCIGILFFKLLKKRFLRVILTLFLSILLLIVYIVALNFLGYKFLSFSIIFRLIIGSVAMGVIFIPFLPAFIAGMEWGEYFDEESKFLSYTSYFFSIVLGISLTSLISIFMSAQFLIIIALFLIVISLVYFILMDRNFRKINFLYRRSQY